jgi:hypothetical protein
MRKKKILKSHKLGIENSKSTTFLAYLLTTLAGCILICTGCEQGGSKDAPLARQIEQLNSDKTRLTSQLEKCRAENQQLTKQIQAISILPKDKIGNPYKLHRVQITGYTNFYDKNKDGKKESLIVYLQPIDTDGDFIKAAGTVNVQLWNLNNPTDKALLGQWRVEPGELRKMWFATLITTNYRLIFDVGDKVGSINEPLTVKVTFTDYLTGQIFEEQKVIKPL